MSPSKFQEAGGNVTRGAINGPRPSTLRINKDSHAIHKPSLLTENPSHASGLKTQNTMAKRQPVIIYTHSPKIIHAQARDFMALVQKLTGFMPSEENVEKASKPEPIHDEGASTTVKNEDVENESSSVLTTEEKHAVGEANKHDSSSAVSPLYGIQANPYMPAADVPLFAPNSHLFQSPSFGSISPPSFMDFMKGFGEY